MGHVFKKRNSWITLWVLTFSLPVTNQNYPWEEILPSLCPVCFPSICCHSGWSFSAVPSLSSQHEDEDAALMAGMQVPYKTSSSGKQTYSTWHPCAAKITGSPQHLQSYPTPITGIYGHSPKPREFIPTWAVWILVSILQMENRGRKSAGFNASLKIRQQAKIWCLFVNIPPLLDTLLSTGYACIIVFLTCAATR